MKKRSLIWKTGCAVAIAIVCSMATPAQRSTAQYQSQDPFPVDPQIPKLNQPSIGLPPNEGRLCDRLTNSICGVQPSPSSPIVEIDGSETEAICGYVGNCPPTPNVTVEFVKDAIQKAEQATDSLTALVYLRTFDDRVEILVIPSSGKEIRKTVPIQATAAELSSGKDIRQSNLKQSKQNLLTETVQDLLDSIRDPSSNDYLQPAQKLYNWLIRPINDDLQAAQIKTLVFVMDGPLRAIPIGALHDGNKFLVQQYATATVPSMGLVNLQLRDRRRSSILVMGLTEAQQGFSALPNVEVETNVITSSILEGKVFLNEKFTIDTLTKQQNTNNYGIVHIATHAQFLSDTANGAFIQFWNDRLYLDKLRTLRLGGEAVEMLTLSACETAVGQNLGLSGTALMYNAKSVLASLWTVSDAGTTPLMLAFYNNYSTAKSKAIAIQKSQLDLLEGRVQIISGQIKGIGNLPLIPLKGITSDIKLTHPYFWASFVLVGNWL